MFQGRTTPDFHYTASFLENSTRAITSPLNLNDNTIIPIAIAFNETIHAYFKLAEQAKQRIKCFGCMKISFPLAILKFMTINDLPNLEFELKSLNLQSHDDALAYNKQLLISDATKPQCYQFNVVNLVKELKEQYQSNKHAAFFNFELLKYDFKCMDEPPMFLNSNWSYTHVNNAQVELNFNLEFIMNYKQSHLSNVNFMLSLIQQAGKYNLSVNTSDPKAQIQITDEKFQVLWQFLNLNKSDQLNLKIFLNIVNPNAITVDEAIKFVCEQPLYVKFHIDNQTLSGVKLDVLSSSYKLSLVKKRIESGKYFCAPFLNPPAVPLASEESVEIEVKKPENTINNFLPNAEDCEEQIQELYSSPISHPIETLIMNF